MLIIYPGAGERHAQRESLFVVEILHRTEGESERDIWIAHIRDQDQLAPPTHPDDEEVL